MNERYSSAQLSARWSIPARTLRDILASLDSTGGYDGNEAADAVVAHFKGLSERVDAEAAGDRARKNKADADTAEVIAAEKRGLLMLKSDARLIWADATIEVRRVIESRDDWKSGELLTALSKIKPADPDEA